MIVIAFFISIFSTLGWLIFSLLYVSEKLHGVSIDTIGAMDLLIYVTIVSLPIFAIWAIFNHINIFLNNHSNMKKLQQLFIQMKKNQDYSDLIARTLIEGEQTLKASIILNNFEFFISELNNLIAEILEKTGTAETEIQDAWFKLSNGEKWIFSKMLIKKNERDFSFQNELTKISKTNNGLAGAISEFCIRYKDLLSVLEKNDRNNIFLNIIETGSMAKVFLILSASISKAEAGSNIQASAAETFEEDSPYSDFEDEQKEKKPSLFSRIFPKKKDEYIEQEKDEPTINKDSFYMFSENKKNNIERREPSLRNFPSFDEDEDNKGFFNDK